MPRHHARNAGITPGADMSWRRMYMLGGITSLLSLALTLLDIVLSMLPGWETATVPETTSAWFSQLQSTPVLGLRNLDLLNVVVALIGIPTYLAIVGAQRKTSVALSALALIVTVMGDTVFASANAALPMLALSQRYAGPASDTQRLALEAAGQALLARGAHGSMGACAGFILPSIGALLFGMAMLQGGVFDRITAWLGIAGMSLLTVYTITNTLVPDISDVVMMLALPGGLFMIAWNVRVAVELFRLSRREVSNRGQQMG